MHRTISRFGLLPVFLFTCLGFLVLGYHPGAEDDAVYLAAIKNTLNPALYPRDAAFFAVQMKNSVFDAWMGHLIHATGISIAMAEFIGQWISFFFLLWACWMILCRLFEEQSARWGGLAMLSAMFGLPVAGTALTIADQYLHPRNPATALILIAVWRILSNRRWQAAPPLVLAFLIHPLMGALGISFNCVLALTLSEPVRNHVRAWRMRLIPESAAAAAIPFAWLLKKPAPGFMDAVNSHQFLLLYHWEWYEWLGALGPLVIFWALSRVARKQGNQTLSRFAMAVLVYGMFQQIVAMVLLGPKRLEVLTTLEPMRFLQLIYVFMTLIAGAYIGKYLLKATLWRWAAFLLVVDGSMCYAQHELFPASDHIEMPGAASDNAWVQAFQWIEQNTPEDAYFAVDPYYMSAPGNDYHSFRALAGRSVMADQLKDSSIVTKAPMLGVVWESETRATEGWAQFRKTDFERLKTEFGVDWVLAYNDQAAQLDCRWHNNLLSVCRIP